MSFTTGAASGLNAALLLARGRPQGALLVGGDMDAAARSFWAAALCLPAFVCLRLFDWMEAGVPPHAAHLFASDLSLYALDWVAFAVISHPLARAVGRAERWPRFIGLWNWCNVVQYTLLVAAGLPGLLGAPAIVSQTAGLVAAGWALWLEWYAARLTLNVGPSAALGIVLIDVSIGIFLQSLADTLTQALG